MPAPAPAPGPRRPLAELVAPDWAEALAPVEDRIRALGDALRAETAAGRAWLPAPDDVLRAFRRPLADVRVLVLGQDPYPTPGHATGLAFSVAPDVRPIPRSLQNVYREIADDVGGTPGPSGDLTPWAEQGVLLLNRVLTVRAGAPGSHRSLGWQEVTAQAVRVLARRHAEGAPLVAVLWGRDAATAAPLLGDVPVVAGVHPSPLSASRGFFGSRPFSRVDALLAEQGEPPVDWSSAGAATAPAATAPAST
ncbi:uracil-DNA glycosylase [Actinotalea sp. AC32]|nr:uracil-DNA glycosylase [Actinotalea sp. AC32]